MACPGGYSNLYYRKFPQSWPAADAYTRVCQRDFEADKLY